jgi:hypothetical protein
MKKFSLPTIQQIIAWANGGSLMFLGGRPEMPYILKGRIYHYFKLHQDQYNLLMTSEKDLGVLS